MSSPRSDVIAARAPALLRLAHQMLGDADAAVDAVCDALSRRGRLRRGTSTDDDEALLRDLVVAVRARAPTATDTSWLGGMPVRDRVVAALVFGQGWDPDGVAEVMRSTRRRVRADLARLVARHDDATWRQLLEPAAWALAPPTDLDARCRRRRQLRRARNAHRLLATGAAVTATIATVTAIDRTVNPPPAPPAAAHVRGLLSWPPRGELVRDGALIEAAEAAWRPRGGPTGATYVLYAGRIGGGRLVVLQGVGADGRPEVAIAADADGGAASSRLQLDLVASLPRTDVPLLAIPYFAPGRAHLSEVVQPRMVRLLVAPGIDAVTHRAVLNDAAVADGFLRFRTTRLTRGLSTPWTDLTGEEPDTAVRAYRGGRLVFTGLLAPGEMQPAPVAARVVPAPPGWTPGIGIGPRDRTTVAADALWWAQFCARPAPQVALAWVGTAPRVPSRVRLELVRCTPDSALAAFVTGSDDAPRLLDLAIGTADVYVAHLRSPGDPVPAAVVAVGSTRVGRIVVGRRLVVHARVAVDPNAGAARVSAYDLRGHRLTVL